MSFRNYVFLDWGLHSKPCAILGQLNATHSQTLQEVKSCQAPGMSIKLPWIMRLSLSFKPLFKWIIQPCSKWAIWWVNLKKKYLSRLHKLYSLLSIFTSQGVWQWSKRWNSTQGCLNSLALFGSEHCAQYGLWNSTLQSFGWPQNLFTLEMLIVLALLLGWHMTTFFSGTMGLSQWDSGAMNCSYPDPQALAFMVLGFHGGCHRPELPIDCRISTMSNLYKYPHWLDIV